METHNIQWSQVGLGTAPDRTLAERLGVHHSIVTRYRNHLGIKPFGKSKHRIDWAQQPLGKMPDAEVAKQLGTSRPVVTQARQRFGIDPYDPSRSMKRIEWDSTALGLRPDAQIAQDLGVATSVVLNARRRRGIKRCGLPSLDVEWGSLPLGKHTDQALAFRIGTTQQTVSRHRKRLGILPSKHRYVTTEAEGANFPEATIDLYWHAHQIPHQFQVRIGRFIADWIVHGDTVVEYAGLATSPRWGQTYRDRLAQKIAFYQQKGLKVLVIYPTDLRRYCLDSLPQVKEDPC